MYGSQIETQQRQQQKRWGEEVVFEAKFVLEEGRLEEGVENVVEGRFERNFQEGICEERRKEVVSEKVVSEEGFVLPQEQHNAQHGRGEEAAIRSAHVISLPQRIEPRWQKIFPAFAECCEPWRQEVSPAFTERCEPWWQEVFPNLGSRKIEHEEGVGLAEKITVVRRNRLQQNERAQTLERIA